MRASIEDSRRSGAVWITIGLTMFVGGITLIGFARYSGEDAVPRILAFIFGTMSVAIAYRAIYRGRRWCSLAAGLPRTVHVLGTTPEFLYLRSFRDEYVSLNARGIGETSMFGRGIAGWQQLAVAPRAEDVLVSSLKRAGEIVSLGDPRELLPHPGATREPDSTDWEQQFQRLARSVRAVIVLIGTMSDGLLWELKFLAEGIEPVRLVLYLPYSADVVENVYQQFCSSAPATLADHLPNSSRQALFIRFREDWSPEFIGLGLGFTEAVSYLLRVIPQVAPTADANHIDAPL